MRTINLCIECSFVGDDCVVRSRYEAARARASALPLAGTRCCEGYPSLHAVDLGTASMRFSRLRCSVNDPMRKSFVCAALVFVALVIAGCRGGPDKAGGTSSPKAMVLT